MRNFAGIIPTPYGYITTYGVAGTGAKTEGEINMAMKIYGIFDETGSHVLTVQCKRKDMAEKCIAEYIRIGRISSGNYYVKLIRKENS